jgi:hypothetical protein
VHRPAFFGEAGHAVGRIQAAGEGEGDDGAGWLHNA